MAKKKTAKKVSSKTRAVSKAGVAAPKKELTAAQKAAQVKREIEKRNKLFAAADAAGKRVLIAKDVIAQIKLGKFNPVTGSWVDAIDYRHNILAAALWTSLRCVSSAHARTASISWVKLPSACKEDISASVDRSPAVDN